MDQKNIVKEKLWLDQSTSVLQKDLSFDSLSNSSYFDSSEIGSVSSMDESITECGGHDSQYFSLEQLREKYKKEFRSAIKDNYKFMMNEDMVESCKLTDCELSVFDSDDEENSVSYKDFVKQYNDLVDWLSAIYEQITKSNPICLSEKYLNHAYHEELLQRLIRRTQFDEYATQLIIRYPYFKEDIILKKEHIAEQWNKLEKVVSSNDYKSVLKDVELDLSNFESWLILTNKNLKELQYKVISDNVSRERMLEIYMVQHKEVQPKYKLINSMLQMCDYILSSWKPLSPLTRDRIANAKNKAMVLQHIWETLFIQILEWQLRIEGNYDLKCKWNNEIQIPNLNHENDSVTSTSKIKIPAKTFNYSLSEQYRDPTILSGIHTNENKGYFCDTVVNHICPHIERSLSFNSKFSSELKNKSCCNLVSDFSDSSGIGISITDKSKIHSNKVPDVITNYKNVDIASPSEPESSLFFTEDEFYSDEILFNSTAHTLSLDILSHSFQPYNSSYLPNSTMTDGKLYSNNSIYKHKSKMSRSRKFQVKRNFKFERNSKYADKRSKHKHSVKRRFTNNDSLIQHVDSVPVPKIPKIFLQNMKTESDIKDQGYAHLIPGVSNYSPSSDMKSFNPEASEKNTFESDSDEEDFRIMMNDNLKAFNFTKNCVAKRVRSMKMFDPIELLEPLATCQTSIKCLKGLEAAFNSTKTENFGTLDIFQLQELLKDWINLEAQILYHLQSWRQLFLSQVDLLQKQIYCCESVLKSVDITDFSPDVLLNAIHCFKTEKEKLLDIKHNVEKLIKTIAFVTNKKYPTDVLAYNDISLRLEYFSVLCYSLITRVGASLYSYLEIFEPSYKFYKLVQETSDLMRKCVKMDTQAEFISTEKSGIWTELRRKYDEMNFLLTNVKLTNPVKKIFQDKLKSVKQNLEIKKNVYKSHVLNDHQTADVEYGHGRKIYGLIKKIMFVGLPFSAVLLFGWVLKSSSFCEESLHDWDIVLFPNLYHSRGRPPT